MKHDTIIVLDFGGQSNQLIVRRFRELGVYSELWSYDTDATKLQDTHVKGIVLSGSPLSANDSVSMHISEDIMNIDKPILGICYGMQTMVSVLGGQVGGASKREYGAATLNVSMYNAAACDPLFANIPNSTVWMSHQDEIVAIPPNWQITASTDNCQYAAISHSSAQRWAVQFHPEYSHTDYGMQILENFALTICKAAPQWTMNNYITELETEIIAQVGQAKVICALSGGVDSAVTAAILLRAIGTQLHCIYVDNGLMRAQESDEVIKVFGKRLGSQFHAIDASKQFFAVLKGITNPEEKRTRIGHEFIKVFTEATAHIPDAIFLAQGTLYTDIVESGKGGNSQTIKSHHNVGGLPQDMKFALVEPLKKLFKDEVRDLGTALGLPASIVQRQPFPGPGLGIRVIGEVTPSRVALVRQTDYILRDEIANAGLSSKIWQYFTALPGIKTVGLRGDQRSYSDAIILRAICSKDGMSASVAEIPFAVLQRTATRITNEVEGINRVLLDITDKPPGTIEFE